MPRFRFAGVVVCATTFCGVWCVVALSARADAPKAAAPKIDLPSGAAKADLKPDPNADALKDKGLVKSGDAFVLADEAPVLSAAKSLRLARKQADRESLLRKKAEDKVAANQKFIKDGVKEYKDLEKRLAKVKDVSTHNRMVGRMNALASKVKESIDNQKDLEAEANKVSSEAKTKYIDELMALAPKVDAAAAKYKMLAADLAVKSVIDRLNAKGGAKVAVRPSPEFNAAVDEVATWRSQIDSEAIPLREDHGVYSVEVLVNGERLRMLVDTGASHVTLPYEVAKKLDLTPGENDPTVQMQLADGVLVDGKLMTLKSVRVGRFTVENVSCIVFPEGLPKASTILGTSFLSHFVVKLSQSAGELYLTEVGDGKKPTAGGEPK